MADATRLEKKLAKKVRARKQLKRRVSKQQGTLSAQVTRLQTGSTRKKRAKTSVKVTLKKVS